MEQRPALQAGGRRAEIAAIAGEVIAMRGFRYATVREIAAEAQILSGSLYHHFSSKEEMLEEILRPFLENTLEIYRAVVNQGGTPEEVLAALLEAAFMLVADHRVEMTIMQNDYAYLRQQEGFGFVRELYRDIMELWTTVIDDGVQRGDFAGGLDSVLIYRGINGTVFSVVRWFDPTGPMTIHEIIEQYTALFLDGLVLPVHS